MSVFGFIKGAVELIPGPIGAIANGLDGVNKLLHRDFKGAIGKFFWAGASMVGWNSLKAAFAGNKIFAQLLTKMPAVEATVAKNATPKVTEAVSSLPKPKQTNFEQLPAF